MDKYIRAFVVASIFYLLLGSTLGAAMGIYKPLVSFYFTHTHFNLLGFMAMMIYGVGYFILPRFNARALRWPGMVPWHFYTANAGLVGMCLFWELGRAYDPALLAGSFAFFAVVEALSVSLFVVNMVGTLMVGPSLRTAPSGLERGAGREGQSVGAASLERVPPGGGASVARGRIGPVISLEMRVGEILERFPGARDLLVEAGIKALADEAHAEQVKKMPVTLKTACRKHGVDSKSLIGKLERFAAGSEPVHGEGEETGDEGKPLKESVRPGGVTKEALIGDILSRYPATETVFKEYFGEGCFDCPGQVTESVEEGARMHNVDADELVRKLNDTIEWP